MPRIIPDELVEPVVAALLGAIDLGDGGTAEQRHLLSALVVGYWERPDLCLEAVEPRSAEQAAAVIVDPRHRRRLRELLVLLEMCRYPLSAKQVERVDAYAQAIDEDGPGLSMARTIIAEGAEKALADFARFYPEAKRAWSEQSMLSGYEQLEEPDPQLALRMLALHDLPEGTWGYEFVEFYRRNGLELPGVNPKTPAFFFAHDMNHVIAGYEPVGIEEVALSGMILASDDSDENWMLMVTSLAAYQVGVLNSPEFEAKEAIFEREGAVEVFAEAFRRGANCKVAFSSVDHWALVDRPLDEIRASFGIEDRRI